MNHFRDLDCVNSLRVWMQSEYGYVFGRLTERGSSAASVRRYMPFVAGIVTVTWDLVPNSASYNRQSECQYLHIAKRK